MYFFSHLRGDTIGEMRLFIALGVGIVGFACVAAAQPAENPALQNTGKPMILPYLCGEEDIRSAGLSCTIDDPCAVFLELASVEAVGNRIFVAGNIHSSSTTLYSVLLASDDGGKTWHEPHERIRLAGLDRIQFIDFENGWVAGEVQHPLPRDPFLLATTDGGKTWQAQPIFGDPQFGAIVDFWFQSRTSGVLSIYRGGAGGNGQYELYETPNAGETWMLRQTSERLIELMQHSPNADWRLRPDAASKSNRVEHRVGGQWHSVAAFSVGLAACQPPEPSGPPPAPSGPPPAPSAPPPAPSGPPPAPAGDAPPALQRSR